MAYGTSECKRSCLLSHEENELIFSLLGPKCITLATTVAELYFSRGRYGDNWQYKDFGVLCLVKDNYKRSYFFRLYCPLQRKLLWEHEVYNNLEYLVLTPYLHVFEAEDCITGFNFADHEEGGQLKAVLLHKLECKRLRRERKRVEGRKENNYVGTPRRVESNGYLPPSESTPSVAVPLKDLNLGGKKDSKKRLTKADIGSPFNYRHVSHVGWDPQRGFEVDKVQDPELVEFFIKAGVSENQLQDKETREFIYDFILTHGGMDAVKEDIEVRASPPTRGRAPPPPPSRAPPATPPPPPPPPPIRTLPPRIVPQSKPTAAVAPLANAPPPPPPPGPPCPPPPPGPPLPPVEPPPASDDPRSALMEAIRSGKTLKPVSGLTSESKKQSDSRGELMDQIRQGVELKSVTNTNNSHPAPQPTEENSLAGALARALAERTKAIYSDSSDTSDEEGEDEWDDP